MVRLSELEKARRLAVKELKKIESRPNLWKFMKSYGLDQGKQYKNLKTSDMMNEINKQKEIKLKYLFTQMNTYEMSPLTVNNFADRVIEASDDSEVYAVEMYDNNKLVKTITLSRNIDPLVIKLICKKSITEAIDMIDSLDNDNEYSYKAELTQIYNSMNINKIKIVKTNSERNLTNRSGAYLNRLNLTKFDLSRYGLFNQEYYDELIIHNEDEKNILNENKRYVPQCLIHSLEQSNIDNNVINEVKLYLGSYYVRRTQLPDIAKIINRNIKIHSFRNTVGRENEVDSKIISGGKDIYESISLAIYNDHFFIYEDTYMEGFPYLTNGNKNGHIHRSSLHVIKNVLSNNNLSKLIPFDMICKTEEYHQFKYELEFNSNTILRYDPYPIFEERNNKSKHIYYFDFESSTRSMNCDEIDHIPFMVSISNSRDKYSDIQNFTGIDCAKTMLMYIQSRSKGFKGDIILYAHNAKYDFSFIQHHVKILNYVEKKNQFYTATCMFGSTKFIVKDSYKLLPMKLSDFASNFDIENIQKEIMPYEAYNIYRDGITLEDRISLDTLNELYDKKYCDEFISHAKDYIDERGLKSLEYARFYCNQDVTILRKGVESFKDIMLNIVGLNIHDYITISSIANAYMEKSHVYDETYKISTSARLFIEKCIIGGVVATKHNKKQEKINTSIEAADANSLYPSAMVELCKQGYGIPKGKPNVFDCSIFGRTVYDNIPDELKDFSYFFVEIQVLYVKDNNYDIDIFSYKKNDKRINTHKTDGPIVLNVDKITLLDYINFHQIRFRIQNCIYYNDGFNTKIGEKIIELYEDRKEAKKTGKIGISNCIKLIMNSIYGRTILSHNSTSFQYKYDDEINSYIFNNHNIIKNIVRVNERCSRFEIYVPNNHSNLALAGVMILSMSKHMMNRASLACKKANVSIYYKDTDSLHIKKRNIEKINDEYKKMYNTDMFGTELGQFSSDFDMKIKCRDIICTDAIYIAKKVYYERLQGVDVNGNIAIQHDCVIKGINRASIDKVVREQYYGSYKNLFKDLSDGKSITFDLSATRPCFKHLPNGIIISNLDFKRTLKF